MEDALLQSGGTAGLIAAIWGVAAAIKTHREKQNGGNTFSKIKVLEHKVSELQSEVGDLKTKLALAHRDLCEMREEARLFFMKYETRLEVERELNQ